VTGRRASRKSDFLKALQKNKSPGYCIANGISVYFPHWPTGQPTETEENEMSAGSMNPEAETLDKSLDLLFQGLEIARNAGVDMDFVKSNYMEVVNRIFEDFKKS
jgi:hypothetical protein